MAGRHRAGKGRPSYLGSKGAYKGKRRAAKSGSAFGDLFGRLRPGWTPTGGFPTTGPPGVFPGFIDSWTRPTGRATPSRAHNVRAFPGMLYGTPRLSPWDAKGAKPTRGPAGLWGRAT